jgi:hypothetical protein
VSHHALAGEASLCWSTPQRPRSTKKKRPHEEADGALVELLPAQDPERSAESSVRRARITLRRYCTALGIDRLGTLTFRCRRCNGAPCICAAGPLRPRWEDREQVLSDIEAFRRAMRLRVGRVPLVIVIEHHLDGHLHVHFGFNRFLQKDELRACWPHGFVKMTRRKASRGRPIGRRERARRCAAYLTKYVTKEHIAGSGRKSYSTTRGLVPKPQRLRFMRRSEAMGWLLDAEGRLPASTWSSADVEGWEAPPCWLMFWDEPPDG